MESLPDDVLHQILQIGLKARRLDHVDLCSLAIVNNHFDQLTQDPALWGTLLSRDFPLYSFEAPSKEVYRRRQSFNIFRIFWKKPVILSPITPIRLSESLDHLPRQFHIQSVNINSLHDGQDLVCPIIPIRLSESLDHLTRQFHIQSVNINSLHDGRDSVLPSASQPSLKEAGNRYYESKLSKRFDKSSRPKVIPNSKSYIPLSRPPRRSMPRKN